MNAHADDGANTMRMRHQDIVPQADSGKYAVHPLHVVIDQPNRHHWYHTSKKQQRRSNARQSAWVSQNLAGVTHCCLEKTLNVAIQPDRSGGRDVRMLDKYELMKFTFVTLAMNVI